MNSKHTLLFVFSLIFILTLTACDNSSESNIDMENSNEIESISFKIYTNVPDQHLWTHTAVKFKEILEEQTSHNMTVEVFSNSQLGETDEAQQMLSIGTLDFAFIPTAFLTNDFEELNAWFMPFLFKNLDEAIKAGDSQSAKVLLEGFNEKGIIGMDWLFTGNHDVLMKETILDSPEAFKGKKIRYVGEEPIKDLYNTFGASTVLTPLSEVYTSLQTGIIDGTVGSSNSIEPAKFYEVANEYTLLNQTAFNAAVLMSQKVHDELSSESQQIIAKAMKEAVEWGNNAAIQDTEEKLELLKEAGVNIHEITNFEPFYKERNNIYQKYSDKYPIIKDFINEVQNQ